MRHTLVALPLLLSACPPTGWELVTEADDRGAYVGVWGASEDDVWIVGGQQTEGLVLRGSADDWEAQELPQGVPMLNWVAGDGPDDVWIGGIQGALLHWDGSSFTDHSQGWQEAIWGTCVHGDDAYAVGGQSGFGGSEVRALRWTGAWSALDVPAVPNLFKCFSDGDDVWMVGSQGMALAGSGDDFSVVPTGYADDLVTAHRGDGPVVAVGGRMAGAIFTGDRSGLDKALDVVDPLFGVHVFASGAALVVGTSGHLSRYDVAANELQVEDPLTYEVLHAVWGLEGGRAYAVGGNLAAVTDDYHGTLLVGPSP